MATAQQTKYTPEDLLNIRDRPMPELVDGELVEREMGQKADVIASNFHFFISSCVRAGDLGLVNGSQGSYQIFPDDPRKVRIPDVSFTRKERLPKTGPAEGHGLVAPDLVVEVIAPNDSASMMQEKIDDYLAAGIPLVWVANPDSRSVTVWRQNGTGCLLRIGDTLEGEDVLPGFRVEVATLFT